jgi:arabinose-5-phosphate isomerase
MLKELLTKQKSYTQHYFEHLDLESTQKIIDLILKCKGIVFLTGVGKSGLIANKIAFTMVSTGTRAMYISPIDAVHGDLGMVTPDDIFIMLSKSGETDELISLVPAIRNKGATLVGLVCNAASRLAASCHHVMVLPFEAELCPYDLSPTMSTIFQLLFGDLVAVALMRHKDYSISEFALNHPSGRIGKRITMRVRDLMIIGNKIPLCLPQDTLQHALVELSNKRCGCILVADEENNLLGLFTDGDLRRTLQKMGGEVLGTLMRDLMTVNPKSIDPDVLAWDAMKFMESDYRHRIMMLPVIDKDNKVQGLLHLHDIIQSGL